MPYGLLTTGFAPKPLLVLKEEIEAAWRAEFGQNVILDPNEPDGQIIGIFVDRLAELWELAQAVYSAYDPDKAMGQAQDALCALTGTVRDPAVESTVTLTATGTPGTNLTTGREASVTVTGDRFRTLSGVTITALTGWAPTTAYVVGDRRTNSSKCYLCITAGTSAGSGGPTGTGSDITDGTVHWRYLGDGTGAIDVAAEAVETGPIIAVSGTVTVIETPVSGWDSVINILDAVVGADVEADDDLRVKREAEIATSGSATAPGARANVLQVEGVTEVVVFENKTPLTDADGRPPHSMEFVVRNGADADIRAEIYRQVGGGIETFGSVSGTVTDSEGFPQTVRFNRPSQLNIWVAVTVTKDPSKFPSDGADLIKAAIIADEPNYPIGKNVTASRVASCVWRHPTTLLALAGVLDVTVLVGLSDPPGSASVTVDPRQAADFDTSRITVTLFDGTP